MIKTIDLKKYELIIFDCDGTLVDSELLSNSVIAAMMRELGIQISDQEAEEKFSGTSFKNITRFLEKSLERKLDFDFEAAFRPRVLEVFEKELKEIPDASWFVDQIPHKKCVASNGPKEKMKATLTITNMLHHFEQNNMFSAYDLGKWKPEPDLFLHAAKQMNTDITKVLVIEDTYSGAMGAKNAGMDVLVYVGSHDPKGLKEQGFSTFSTYRNLI